MQEATHDFVLAFALLKGFDTPSATQPKGYFVNRRFNHSTSQPISVFIVIFISISLCLLRSPTTSSYGEIYVQAQRTNSIPSLRSRPALERSEAAGSESEHATAASNDVSQNIDAVLLIDNSGSMDLLGHDPEGNRFEGAKVFIDKSEYGDNIALVDFSGSSELIMPLTKVTEARKSIMKSIVSKVRSDRKLTDINSALEIALQELSSNRANPAHTPVVILLTDGEIDVVLGAPEEKRRAAKESEAILFSKTLPKYIQSYIPIYTVALRNGIDTTALEKLAEQSMTREQANERHYFSVPPGTDLIDIFSFIQSQLKKKPRVAQKYHFTGEPIHHTVETTPFTNKVGVEVLLDHKKDMQVAMTSPSGDVVEPYSQGDKYNLYKVDNPETGQWSVSIEGKGENEIILATYVDDEIKIDLPFKSRFRLGEPIQIFANIMNKNNIVEGNTVEVEFSGRNYTFRIKGLLLTILSPGGRKKGPFPLQREGGSYTYFYEADMVGDYTFDFTLRGNVRNRDVALLAQKKVLVFQAMEPPTLLFKPLKPNYSLGDTLTLQLSVIKNAQLMQNSSVLVEVNSPRGTEILSVPRKGLNLYSLQYTQTDQKGEYTFTVMKTEGYEVAGFQQSILIRPPSVFPWKLLAPILAVSVLAIVGLLAVGTKNVRFANLRLRLTGWYPRSEQKAEEAEEDISPEEVEEEPAPETEEEAEEDISIEEVKEPAPEVQEAGKEQLTVEHPDFIGEEIEEPAPDAVASPAKQTAEEAEEDMSPEEVKEPPPEEIPTPLPVSSEGAAYPMPDEIFVWDKYAIVEHIRISERIQKDGEYAYYFECLNRHNVILNDTPLTKESIVIKHDDIVKIPPTPLYKSGAGGISFRVDLSGNAAADAIVSYSEGVKLEISDEGDLIRWFVLPAIPPPPQIGDSIEMVFAQGNLLHIGRDLMLGAFEPNDIILYHPSVVLRQVAIRRDETQIASRARNFDYFIRALENETILNDSVLAHGREEKLSDGDVVKTGFFTFRVKLDEGEPRLEIIEYRG